MLLSLVLLAGCDKPYDEKSYVILKEVITADEHYQIVADMDYVYMANIKTGGIAKLRPRNGELLPALRLNEDVVTEIVSETTNPMLTGLAITEDIPNTYIAEKEVIAEFLYSLYNGNFTLVYLVATNEYIDIVIEKDGVQDRIVVLHSVFKVFQDVKVKTIDAATYINEI